MVTDMTKQNARIAARRTTTAIGVTGDTVRTVRFRSRNLPVDPPKLLRVRNRCAIWVRNAGGTGGARRVDRKFCNSLRCQTVRIVASG